MTLLAAMRVTALLAAMKVTDWGTAQDFTAGLFFGATIFAAIMTLFYFRSGHERAHRRHVLRKVDSIRQEQDRPKELRDLEPPPQSGENKPR